MAIYHFNAKMICRSKGKSAIERAAHHSASLLKDERQNLVFNYTKRQKMTYSEILIPANAPEWAKDRERLWNEVEASEKRKDSRLAREIMVAIPKELSVENGIELVKEYAEQEFVIIGMIADINIIINDTNPYAHILLTTRDISETGFLQKNRSWNKKELFKKWRESWAELSNKYLKLSGYDIKIDHRSYKDQGIDLIPTIHLGHNLSKILKLKKADEFDRVKIYKEIVKTNSANKKE
jgi:ATP-dependent exoDNAse (exonuclease V) alpha subunit